MKTRTAVLAWVLGGALFATAAVVKFNVHDHTLPVQRLASQDPATPASAGEDPKRPVRLHPTLKRTQEASAFFLQKIMPFLIESLVGRA